MCEGCCHHVPPPPPNLFKLMFCSLTVLYSILHQPPSSSITAKCKCPISDHYSNFHYIFFLNTCRAHLHNCFEQTQVWQYLLLMLTHRFMSRVTCRHVSTKYFPTLLQHVLSLLPSVFGVRGCWHCKHAKDSLQDTGANRRSWLGKQIVLFCSAAGPNWTELNGISECSVGNENGVLMLNSVAEPKTHGYFKHGRDNKMLMMSMLKKKFQQISYLGIAYTVFNKTGKKCTNSVMLSE